MNESIIVGLVVGSGVAVIGAYIGYLFRLREMKALWTEEEQRRKSDRRRELYEKDLTIVRDSLFAVMVALMGGLQERKVSTGLIAEAQLMIWKGLLVADSVDDSELRDRLDQLWEHFAVWADLLDDTGRSKKGKEKECLELAVKTEQEASEILRRIREMLEKV